MGVRNFKKETITLVLLIFSFIFLSEIMYAEERLNLIQRFSIKIGSGSDYLDIGDINTHLKSGNAKHLDYVQLFDGLKKGELKTIERGSDAGIELTFDITSRFGIYLGSGYFYTRRESSSGFEVTPPDFYHVDFTFSPKISISVIPVKFGVYFTILPFGSRARFYIKGGIGYYFARTNFYWEEREIWTREDGSLFTDIVEMAEWDLKSGGFGYHVEVGLEYNLTRNLSIVVEAQGRLAKLKKLKGTEIFLGTGYSESFYGAVYFYEKKDSITEKYYFRLGFYKEKPDLPSPKYRNIRDAELDLSGYSLKIGIRIRLF